MSWTGTLRWIDIGTGSWVLETHGRKLNLVGDVPRDLADENVIVKGVELEGMGIGMIGSKIVQVEGVQKA